MGDKQSILSTSDINYRKPRVLVLQVSDNWGGIESFIKNIIVPLSDRFEITLGSIDASGTIQDRFGLPKSSFFELPSLGHPIRYLKGLVSLASMDFDIIHFNKNSAMNILPIMIANHFSRSKLVVHSHNTAPYKRSILSFIHYINRIYVNHIADVRIACSSAAGEYMFGRRYIGKFHILKNGIFLPKFVYNLVTRKKYRRNFNFADDSLVIGCVGQLSNRKNQFFLLKIMKKIVSFKPNSHLLLVGEGPAESMLREQVKSLAIENNVSFLGERNDVSSLYQMMDIAVFPSISEGLPISVIEAQASGLRTIISDQITKEVQLTPKVERLSLKDSVDTWAAEILKDDNQKPGREKDVQYIEQNGYSAVLSSEELSNIYTDLLLG